MRHVRTQLLKAENPFHIVMSKLHEHEDDTPAPRQLAAWQLYMSKKREEISKIYDERWPTAGLPDTHKIAFRSSIARELLGQESVEYRASLEAEVQEIRLADDELENEPLYPKASEDELVKITIDEERKNRPLCSRYANRRRHGKRSPWEILCFSDYLGQYFCL